MKRYRIEVTGDRFPTTYMVEATSWGTAVSRGIREWKKRFKGSRTQELTIRAFVGDVKEVPTDI
ncbi:MAG TPA: hypothetical protein ENI23_15885 [bacterium]|nr:hypothetical protein [bacterium]